MRSVAPRLKSSPESAGGAERLQLGPAGRSSAAHDSDGKASNSNRWATTDRRMGSLGSRISGGFVLYERLWVRCAKPAGVCGEHALRDAGARRRAAPRAMTKALVGS